MLEAIIQYAVAHKTGENGWAELAKAAHSLDIDVLKNTIAEAEKQFKDKTGEKHPPSTWRSAKSVVIRAKEKGISLVSENGTPLGKSAIEALLKEKKPIDPLPMRVEKQANVLKNLINMEADGDQREMLTLIVQRILAL